MPTIQDGEGPRKLLEKIPRERIEAILRVYHHIRKVKQQAKSEIHEGVEIKTPGGSLESVGGDLPLYAARQYIEIKKRLYSLQKTNYLKSEFVNQSLGAAVGLSEHLRSSYQYHSHSPTADMTTLPPTDTSMVWSCAVASR